MSRPIYATVQGATQLTQVTVCKNSSDKGAVAQSMAAHLYRQPPARSCPLCHQREVAELRLPRVMVQSAAILHVTLATHCMGIGVSKKEVCFALPECACEAGSHLILAHS